MMSTDDDKPEWPGLDCAYEFVRPSYDLVLKQVEAAGTNGRATLTLPAR
jgi:hypothetical protein